MTKKLITLFIGTLGVCSAQGYFIHNSEDLLMNYLQSWDHFDLLKLGDRITEEKSKPLAFLSVVQEEEENNGQEDGDDFSLLLAETKGLTRVNKNSPSRGVGETIGSFSMKEKEGSHSYDVTNLKVHAKQGSISPVASSSGHSSSQLFAPQNKADNRQPHSAKREEYNALQPAKTHLPSGQNSLLPSPLFSETNSPPQPEGNERIVPTPPAPPPGLEKPQRPEEIPEPSVQSELLASIRKGVKLKKVEKNSDQEEGSFLSELKRRGTTGLKKMNLEEKAESSSSATFEEEIKKQRLQLRKVDRPDLIEKDGDKTKPERQSEGAPNLPQKRPNIKNRTTLPVTTHDAESSSSSSLPTNDQERDSLKQQKETMATTSHQTQPRRLNQVSSTNRTRGGDPQELLFAMRDKILSKTDNGLEEDLGQAQLDVLNAVREHPSFFNYTDHEFQELEMLIKAEGEKLIGWLEKEIEKAKNWVWDNELNAYKEGEFLKVIQSELEKEGEITTTDNLASLSSHALQRQIGKLTTVGGSLEDIKKLKQEDVEALCEPIPPIQAIKKGKQEGDMPITEPVLETVHPENISKEKKSFHEALKKRRRSLKASISDDESWD